MKSDCKEISVAPGVCRLCGGALQEKFSMMVLERHQVRYLQCEACALLQTESPYWLAEAYASNLSLLDTGAAQRNLDNQAASYLVARVFKLKDILDYGGGLARCPK